MGLESIGSVQNDQPLRPKKEMDRRGQWKRNKPENKQVKSSSAEMGKVEGDITFRQREERAAKREAEKVAREIAAKKRERSSEKGNVGRITDLENFFNAGGNWDDAPQKPNSSDSSNLKKMRIGKID